jgi:hypothetical protein
MSEPQPIGTAPRDGRRILLFGTCHFDGARNYPSPPMWVTGVYARVGEFADVSREWEADPADYYTIEVRPTHWRPLPAPPIGANLRADASYDASYDDKAGAR